MSAALSLKTSNNKASYIRLNQADKRKDLKDVKTERFLSEIIPVSYTHLTLPTILLV